MPIVNVMKEKEMQNAYIGEDPFYDGLLGYRPLKENLNDIVGGNNGSWSSGTGSFVTAGGYTGAKTEANTSYSVSSRHIVTTLTCPERPISVCMWVYPYSSADNCGLMGNSNGTPAFCFLSTANPHRISLWQGGGDTNFGRYRADNNDLVNNTWQCIGLSVDANGTTFYINGQPVSSSLYNGTRPNGFVGGGAIRIGAGNYSTTWSSYQGLNGLIREVAIWNRKLDDNEFLEFYNNTN